MAKVIYRKGGKKKPRKRLMKFARPLSKSERLLGAKTRCLQKKMIDVALMLMIQRKVKISRASIKHVIMRKYKSVKMDFHAKYMLDLYIDQLVKYRILRSCSKFCFEVMVQPKRK
ncbi:uncharacterized protein LOC119678685 [Teleopsis dalmanni]|uniref:uncharacterized protein LOC119678685 n=1 Tax=Teleopsis dalmanni TaxID=139649 RepID=UPI0018CF9262|nr:uncharacterized protein LOC119678685 [Teleopsis dalmanni]